MPVGWQPAGKAPKQALLRVGRRLAAFPGLADASARSRAAGLVDGVAMVPLSEAAAEGVVEAVPVAAQVGPMAPLPPEAGVAD